MIDEAGDRAARHPDSGPRPQVWVLAPAYNEQDNLPVLHQRLDAIAEDNPEYEFRFLIVDDHSSDATPAVVRQLIDRDPRVCALRLAGNRGSHAAVTAGMASATGDCLVLLSSDLQDPPELIPELLRRWQAGAQIVWAVRRQYRGVSTWQRLCSRVYWSMMARILGPRGPAGGADFFLADRRVVEVFNDMPERNRSVMAMLTWIGFDQDTVLYDKQPRLHGRSKWSLSDKVKFAIDSVTGYTHLPMRLMSVTGVAFMALALGYAVWIVINAIQGSPAAGWSSLMVIMLLASGLQMGMLGVLGEYLWRTLDETRGRPTYVIERRLNFPAARTAAVSEKESHDSATHHSAYAAVDG